MCLKYNVHILKLFPSCYGDSLLWDSSGGRAIFHEFFLFIFYDFFLFLSYMYFSSRLIAYHSSSVHSPRLDVHTITAICKLIGIWPISLNCSHDWETNNTLSTRYSVKFMGI